MRARGYESRARTVRAGLVPQPQRGRGTRAGFTHRFTTTVACHTAVPQPWKGRGTHVPSHCVHSALWHRFATGSNVELRGTLATRHSRRARRGFTLIELLVVIAIIALLISVMLPALSAARTQGKSAVCATRLKQLGVGLLMYAHDYEGRMMPAAYTSNATVGTGAPIYWWGTNAAAVIDHTKGFVWPYLQVPLDADGVMECPEQPWGSYQPQGAAQQVTSTYGYNGYYLSPAHTPGWSFAIGNRPWQQASTVRDPARVFAFADAAIDLGGSLPRNSALLDPPVLYQGFGWAPNGSPTTSFRHRNRTHAVHVDGHVDSYGAAQAIIGSERFQIGSVGDGGNGPHYVPDWRDW